MWCVWARVCAHVHNSSLIALSGKNKNLDDQQNWKAHTHTQLHLKQTASTLSNWMNKCWAWHGMAWSGKATGWKDYEFVWHCNIPIANETLVDAWALFAIFTIFSFVFSQYFSLCVYWCRIANGVRMQFSGSPFEMKLNKNEKEEEEAEVTEEGKRRHNLSLVLWLVRMDEFFGAQVEYHVAVCAWFIALYDTKSRREIRKNIFNNRRRYAFACTRSSLAYTHRFTRREKTGKKAELK